MITTRFGNMNKIQQRYSITPQMKYYDQFTVDFTSYTMFFNKKNFKSKIINTDSFGFRYNFYDNNIYSCFELRNKKEVSIIIGGSTVFGFGSSNDSQTISSFLSKQTNEIFLNFGATAFNSTQELILFINNFNKFNKIKNVILISGVNDLYLNTSNNKDEHNYFFKKKFILANDLYNIRNIFKKRILYFFYKQFNDKYINPKNIKLKDIFQKKKNIKDFKSIDYDLIDLNYDKIFGVWSSLSKKYNFTLKYFLQPLAGWMNKKYNDIEKKLFNILDNSNDNAHQVLKIISDKSSYEKFSLILKRNINKHDLNYNDLNIELDKIVNHKEQLFVDRVHLTDSGYKIISDIILNKF